MNTTLIIGNGFDLALKLKTSYRDFANSEFWPIAHMSANNLRENSLKNSIYKFTQEHQDSKTGEVRWIDLEAIIKEYALERKEEEESPVGGISQDIIKKDKDFLETLKLSFTKYLCSNVKELIEPGMKGIPLYLSLIHISEPTRPY